MTRPQRSRILPLHVGHYMMPATDTRFAGDRIMVRAFRIEHWPRAADRPHHWAGRG